MARPTHAPGTRSTAVVVAAVAVVILAVVAAVLFRRWSGPGEQVVVLGDSVTYSASQAIHAELDGSADVAVTAKPFYRTTDLVAPLQEVVDARLGDGGELDRLIVLAGYNDVIRDDQEPSGLTRLLDLAGRFDCAVWLTLPARPGGQPAGHADFPAEEVDAWNERVRAEAAVVPRVHVSDEWQRSVEAPGGAALLQQDGVHPVRAGDVALAEAMGHALARECPD